MFTISVSISEDTNAKNEMPRLMGMGVCCFPPAGRLSPKTKCIAIPVIANKNRPVINRKSRPLLINMEFPQAHCD